MMCSIVTVNIVVDLVVATTCLTSDHYISLLVS